MILMTSAIGATSAHATATYLLAYPKAGYETSSSVYTLKADNTPGVKIASRPTPSATNKNLATNARGR